MNKLEMRGMKRNAADQRLKRFLAMVFSIANHGVAQHRKLGSNLILQSRYQLNSDQ